MNYFLKIRIFVKKNEHLISPIAIFGGFILDSLTLGRVDQLFGQIILALYILILGTLIILINSIDSGESNSSRIQKIRPFLSVIMMFSFGNVFSGFTLFYFQSAGSFFNWLFVLILFAILISTEYFKHYYSKIYVQFGVFYFAVFSYLIFLVPIIIKQIGPWIFILSGVVSLILVYLYLKLFGKITHKGFERIRTNSWRVAIGIFVVVNVMYFANIIPPIPLSLKEADVFHYVERKNGEYSVLDEKKSWWQKFYLREPIHIKSGESVYLFSSVFAPTKLDTKIVHEWQRRDEKGKWHTLSKIPFEISGGRDAGYRGYSTKSGLKEGRWRVNIKTPNGQIIGRKVFNIIFTDKEQVLFSETK